MTGVVATPSRMSGIRREVLPHVREWSGGLSDVWEWSGGLPDVRDWSGTLPDVWD